jgi:hypothetical protein
MKHTDEVRILEIPVSDHLLRQIDYALTILTTSYPSLGVTTREQLVEYAIGFAVGDLEDDEACLTWLTE